MELIPYSLLVAVFAVLGGTALARRLHWPFLLPALLSLAISMGSGITLGLLVHFYFAFNDGQGIPWVERLGIDLGSLATGCFLSCIYFFAGACIGAIRRPTRAKT